MSDWYLEWFGEEYLALYAHRNEREADAQIEFVCRSLSPLRPKCALDIGCGNGRHLVSLLKRSIAAVGIDTSSFLLSEAKRNVESLDSSPGVVQADMRRLPFGEAQFDLVLSMFTTFGYLSSDVEHVSLLQEWHKVLSPGGFIFLDYLNRDYVITHLQPDSHKEFDKRTYHERRFISDNNERIIKEITVTDMSTRATRTFKESVRMYTSLELASIITRAGFTIEKTYGDFSGSSYSTTSPRLLCLLRKHD